MKFKERLIMKKYTSPEIEITELQQADVILTSGSIEEIAEVDSAETLSWESVKNLFK